MRKQLTRRQKRAQVEQDSAILAGVLILVTGYSILCLTCWLTSMFYAPFEVKW